MKYIKTIIIITICLIMATSVCFAETRNIDKSTITPYYIVTQNTVESFSINTSGVASMTARLSPRVESDVDQVKITLTIKSSDGTNVYNKTFGAAWSDLYDAYRVNKTYQLQNKGNYTFNVTYKCYKNTTLIETIRTNYYIDAY